MERLRFEREIQLLTGPTEPLTLSRETEEGLQERTANLALLPHFINRGGIILDLAPKEMDPGFYDGAGDYKDSPLQDCLTAMIRNNPKFAHMGIAVADLTDDKLNAPQFAGHKHKQQMFVASVAKIATMLAAFQLRHDMGALGLRFRPTDIDDFFNRLRDDWAATQKDPGGPAQPLGGRLSQRGKLLLSGGRLIPFLNRKGRKTPRIPLLQRLLAPRLLNRSFVFELASTPEKPETLGGIVRRYNKSQSRENEKAIRDLGFLERLGIAMSGAVPASNLAVSTVIADLGFQYIASTLIQSGLYDPNRKGGLWLAADYIATTWNGLPGVHPQSATAGSLVSLMTLMMQERLVGPTESREMQFMLGKPDALVPGVRGWFRGGLPEKRLRKYLTKVGLKDGADEVAYIDYEASYDDPPLSPGAVKKFKQVRYVAAALRAKSPKELSAVITEIDKCIRANNGIPVLTSMKLRS